MSVLFLANHHQSSASTIYEVNGVKVVWPGAGSVRYLSPSTFPPDSTSETLVLEAMALWNIVPASDFEYQFARLDQEFPIDHFDGFNDTAAVPADQLDPGVLGVTFLVNDGPVWYDMDILFSDFPSGVGYDFDPNPSCEVVSAPEPANGFSFLLIATHELGHAAGLGHDPIGTEPSGTPWFVATMNPRYPSGGPVGQAGIIELHTDDRNGLRRLYPHSGLSQPPFVDLASAAFVAGDVIGKAVPVSARPTEAFPGDEVTMTLVIENFGTSNEFFVRQGFYLSADEHVDTDDQFLGMLLWDIAFQDAFEVDVAIPLPSDMPSGECYLGAVLDDLDEIAEAYEDNNVATTCKPLTVVQRPPAFSPFPREVIPCGQGYTGPTPVLSHPINMGPVTWSLEGAPSRMTIDAGTGVISWPSPVPSDFLYVITIRASNAVGSSTQTLFLGVEPSAPQLLAMPADSASCNPSYRSAAPRLASPTCMSPIINWSLDAGPAGMTIDAGTGVVSWVDPIPASIPYLVTIRAINAVGSGTVTWPLDVIGGDMDGNSTIDLFDLDLVVPCLSDPDQGTADGCTCGDIDFDGDIDLFDIASFQTTFGR